MPHHTEIATLAYSLWLRKGRPIPTDLGQREREAEENWEQAERVLTAERGRKALEGYKL